MMLQGHVNTLSQQVSLTPCRIHAPARAACKRSRPRGMKEVVVFNYVCRNLALYGSIYDSMLLLWRHQHGLVLLNSRRIVRSRVDRVRAVFVDVGAFQSVVNVAVLRGVVESILFLIDVAEEDVEQNGHNRTNNGWSAEIPCQVRVGDDRRAGKTDGVREAGVQEVDSRDQTSHVDGSTRVGNTICWNVDEDLGDTTQSVGNGHPPDSNGCDTGTHGAITGAIVAARRLLIRIVVENRVAGTTHSRHHQTSTDTRHGTVVDVELSEEWVQSIVDDGYSDDDTQTVKVL